MVICHSEGHKRGIASNHADVMHWFPKHGKSMDTFRKDVNAAMNGNTGYEQAKKIVQTKAGLADGTMDYLEKYQYAEDLITKLAKAMS